MIADIQTEHHRFGSPDRPPYLIAEIGLNHNGQLDLARRMVDAARASGAHAAKFQLYRSRSFINPEAKLGDGAPGSLADFFAQFELAADDWHALARHTRDQGLDFFCSVFDAPSLEFYRELDARLIKIASCDVNNRLLFEDIRALDPGRNGRPAWAALISTGTAKQIEVERAVEFLEAERPRAILECVSAYPAAPVDYNLALLARWSQAFGCPVGISDHTEGNALSVAAAALGARVIERHFTLDRNLPGPDQGLSLDPGDFARMARAVSEVLAARGGREKSPAAAEDAPRNFGRRALYAKRAVAKGQPIGRADLIASRPGGGPGALSPEDCDGIVGDVARVAIDAGALVTREMLERS